jgi:hypothetical protein
LVINGPKPTVLDMATKHILMVNRPNQTQFDGFGYEFGFSPISKHGYGMGNGYIGTHPEPIPKHVPNAENYFMLICHVSLFDNCRVIKTIINI